MHNFQEINSTGKRALSAVLILLGLLIACDSL